MARREEYLSPSGEPFRTIFCNIGEHAECTAEWCRCECHAEQDQDA